MKELINIIYFISYAIYFLYGFLYSSMYLGGNIVLTAVDYDKSIILPIIGIIILVFLFLSTTFWVFARKSTERALYFYSLSRILLILAPLLVPLFWLFNESNEWQDNSHFIGIVLVYFVHFFYIFVMLIPLWFCVVFWPKLSNPSLMANKS